MRLKIVFMLFAVFFATSIIGQVPEEEQLPPAPEGYSWQRCPEIKGAFLRPDGWYFKESKKGDTLGFFITKEEIVENKIFTTGLTVNVIPNITEKKKMTPYEYARLYRESAAKTTPFDQQWERDMGPFKSLGFVITKKDPAGDFKVHNLLIANNKTGTLYIVLFEAPTAEWEAAWEIANPMLKYLCIDDTI